VVSVFSRASLEGAGGRDVYLACIVSYVYGNYQQVTSKRAPTEWFGPVSTCILLYPLVSSRMDQHSDQAESSHPLPSSSRCLGAAHSPIGSSDPGDTTRIL
jgi:hypothetical protein